MNTYKFIVNNNYRINNNFSAMENKGYVIGGLAFLLDHTINTSFDGTRGYG